MNKLLVVVDYQKDFVDGTLGFARAAQLESGIAALVEQYLAAGEQVVFTLDTHDMGYPETREGHALPVMHCQNGSEGHALYGTLVRYMQDSRVGLLPKVSFGALGYPALLMQPPEQIVLVGVVTNMCVISNAVILQTLYPQAEIVIESSLCASFVPALHSKALEVMESLQMTVR